ncbi:winged helix-turn-helix domain-containing protein [Klebsiella sp. BIGb0407]|uniref:winged helix-turn-helix domain-containing protein n=1 Tax=Klebsiella sp. BIGb0407 TaxID=2940603 RepID=UPI00216A4302|nr:winged helix-turn-helix domain-containing protein [Klebsiella sp. BIGb0407]MCS3430976.1 DNA-binding winged helix-turn-helix (wHTH) protein [Klebsiella sp. BIGb0407]
MHYIIDKTLRFNSDNHTLEQTNEPHAVVTLTITMSRLLLFLIEKHGENVTKDDILSQVWEAHGLRASTNSLNKYISDLRQMFRTLGLNDEIIVTIPRVGFSVPAAIISAANNSEPEGDLAVAEKTVEESGDSVSTYQYILLFVAILFLSGLLFYVFHSENNDEDSFVTFQQTYPIGMIDNCPVVALKPIAENLKSRNMDITRHILGKLGISCEEESLYYVRFSDDVIYHQPGRVFLADCSIRDRTVGTLSSCFNYYGTDYATNN